MNNNRCPITCEESQTRYSRKGLNKLAPKLIDLKDFPYSAKEQREQASLRSSKMSIQGVQPKLSAILNIKESRFDIVDIGGRYILKPQNDLNPELPQNEDITMRLAKLFGIETPFHGLIYCKDGSMTYFIKRFDRISKKRKLALEDFAQVSGQSRETKYNYSMEKVASIIEKYCSFPEIEKTKLFARTIFNFLIGNEDMHLKNFSLITRDNKVELAPAYDFLNTTIALKNPQEEIALTLKGKKSNLKKNIFVNYFGRDYLQLTEKGINKILSKLKSCIKPWESLINESFLSKEMKEKYLDLLHKRIKILKS